MRSDLFLLKATYWGRYGLYVGPSALGLFWGRNLGLRPRLVWYIDAPLALGYVAAWATCLLPCRRREPAEFARGIRSHSWGLIPLQWIGGGRGRRGSNG